MSSNKLKSPIEQLSATFAPIATSKFPEKNSKLLRIEQVLSLYPVCKSQLYNLIKAGKFPKQVRLSPRSVAWREFEVIAFIDSLQGVK